MSFVFVQSGVEKIMFILCEDTKVLSPFRLHCVAERSAIYIYLIQVPKSLCSFRVITVLLCIVVVTSLSVDKWTNV